ncbi:MAG: DNA-binding response regulator [Candidatus Riflebacteria bacterium HGW-Riflebacteria-2]|jgi:two-component system response regulator CpxR|nr:MAG: DNA-binding response regulator [Candidatus Riflebacteria bacterium HGW-Riflebacteria-2]
MKQILIIDDDYELCELLAEYLASEKFTTTSIHNGRKGLEKALTGGFDLIILDVMLPEMNGLDVLKNLRAEANTPVIMLTARGDEIDRILGLELGADDYLPKPFSPRELVARIRAVFRRLTSASEDGSDKSSGRIEIADICIDAASRTAEKGGVSLGLTEVEFAILEQLMRSAGNVVERQILAEKVLGRRLTYDDRSLDVHMSNLRKKIGNGNEAIRTIRGSGYLYVKPEN